MDYGYIFDHGMEYHLEEEARYDAESEVAFHALMNLVRPMLTSQQQDEIIKIYVDATYAKFWAGWHSKGYSQAKSDSEKAKRVSA